MRRALAESYGEIVWESERDTVFAPGALALRSQPPEVLVATPELVAELTGSAGGGP